MQSKYKREGTYHVNYLDCLVGSFIRKNSSYIIVLNCNPRKKCVKIVIIEKN